MDWRGTDRGDLRRFADARNRAILTVLRGADGPLDVTDLADELVDRADGTPGPAEREDELDEVRIRLHHNRLPRLAEAGLIKYDPDTNQVRCRNATVDPEWLSAERFDELLSQSVAGADPDGDAVAVIDGRQSVIDHGQDLIDGSDEELFCMYFTDDLFEEECLRHASAALERGVDIYAGTHDPDIRSVIADRLPEATLWEPQLDWSNPPSRYPRIGWLVVVDRETVMLSVVDEQGAKDTASETALLGDGETNPLVVLVRELLGPRLDHLDYQSENFRSGLPF